ncbi:MAG: DUF2313 domain-containing protein [Polyangiaceae bacterium]|nr:DUF2313 domain-containing protein [Polyangiaceae bacterium]
MGFGPYGGFPRRFGGGKSVKQIIHEDLLKFYKPIFTDDPEQLPWVESYAEASILQNVQICANRLRKQLQPRKMLENLPVWEEATGLRPSPRDSRRDRQAELAAKMRGFGNNAEPDIRDACQELLGENFVDVHYVADDEEITYIPGFNPGPPGLEWSANRCVARVEVRKGTLTATQFDRLIGKLCRLLSDFLPSWMSWEWFLHSTNDPDKGFILDVSLLDETGL